MTLVKFWKIRQNTKKIKYYQISEYSELLVIHIFLVFSVSLPIRHWKLNSGSYALPLETFFCFEFVFQVGSSDFAQAGLTQ
jgi:hypothetical protein